MKGGAAGDLEGASPPRHGGIKTIAMFAAKLAVTGACFWYVSRQIELNQVVAAVTLSDFRWAAFAILVVMLQIPLVAMRWRNILEALVALDVRMTRVAIMAITAIAVFFGQVVPSVASEGLRAWLLVQIGGGWRNALTSVVVDRGVGVALLIAMGFVILLLPSGLIALGGSRELVLVLYGAILLAGLLGLWATPKLVPLLARWRYSRWIASLAADTHRVLLGRKGPIILGIGCLVHLLTIVIVWSLGRAQGLALPVADAAVLFVVMIGVAIVPISISGWGLREVAVMSLLGNLGIAPEKALLFSVCFGLALAVGSLPGALVWLLYSVGSRRIPPAGAREFHKVT
jgi:glycosyltransferase 2 family protein